MPDKERRDRAICFSLTQSMLNELRRLAPTRDSMSSLLREIIQAYLDKQQRDPPK